jgi:hypothetical protein
MYPLPQQLGLQSQAVTAFAPAQKTAISNYQKGFCTSIDQPEDEIEYAVFGRSSRWCSKSLIRRPTAF